MEFSEPLSPQRMSHVSGSFLRYEGGGREAAGSLSLALLQKESLSLRKERVTQVALSCVIWGCYEDGEGNVGKP